MAYTVSPTGNFLFLDRQSLTKARFPSIDIHY